MKKVIVGILVLIMAFGMVACRREVSPSDQVSRDLDGIKAGETEEGATTALTDDQEKYKQESQDFINRVKEFDYEVKQEEISDDGETATVTVVITTYDFGKAYTDACDEVLKEAADGKLGDMNDADRTDHVFKAVFEKLLGVKDKKYTKEVQINCQKDEDGNWDTDVDANKDLQDALMGGLIMVLGQNS